MEDREILDVITALAAEERRLRGPAADGDQLAAARLAQVEGELRDMWRTLRERRAQRAADAVAETVDLTDRAMYRSGPDSIAI